MRFSSVVNQSVIISRLRFPLILLVYLHSDGASMDNSDIPLLESGIYEIVRTLISRIITHSAVPTFFFISGFLMFYRVDSFSVDVYKVKIRKRISSLLILIPYVLWNLIALVVWGIRLHNTGFSMVDIFNHAAENEIRPITLGRKNYLFCGNHEAAQNMAVVCSLLATCRNHDVNPRGYLNDVISQMPYHTKASYEELLQLLPHKWKLTHPESVMTKTA